MIHLRGWFFPPSAIKAIHIHDPEDMLANSHNHAAAQIGAILMRDNLPDFYFYADAVQLEEFEEALGMLGIDYRAIPRLQAWRKHLGLD